MNIVSSFFVALLLAAIAGAALPTQAGINSLLAKNWTGPLWAAFISFVVGAIALFIILVFTRHSMPTLSDMPKLEWWYFTGGVLGVFYVAVATLTAPIIGATQLVAMVIGGQLLMSIALDHFGLFGFARQSLDWQRSLGLALMIIGILVLKK